MDTKRKTVNLPFAGFMAYLRRQGFIIGVDHYLRLQALLNKLGPDCRPDGLKYVLCPIFAASEKQQNQFYRAFDSYFQPMEAAGLKKIIPVDALDSKDVELTGEPVGTPGWKYVLLGVLMMVLAVLVIYRLGSGQEITPRTGTAQKNIPSSTEIDKGKQQGQDSRTGDREMGQTQAGGLDKFRYKPGFFELYGYIIHGVGTLVPFIILFLLEFYKYNRGRLILLKQRGKKPPFVWPVKVETPETGLVKNGQFYQAARLLRRRLKSDVMRLDMEKTLSRTIEKAGFPQLEYKSLTRPPEYLILIDLPAYRDHHAHLFDTLVKALETEGLFVTRYFYENDPRVCFKEPHQQRTYLSDLKARYSGRRLIVFGDGQEWLDPVSGRLDKWTGLFNTWKERAVLTPVPPQEWGLKEIVLAKEFIVLPASLEGLGALVDHFSTRTGYDLKSWKPADSREHILFPEVYHDTGELRNYLGEQLFQWLCACAVYPELHWDLTLYLGSLPCMPEDLVREEHLLRLIRLPWFRTGSMPDELRWALISELDIEKSKVIRTAVIELLEKNPAPRESFAFDSYRLNLVVQRWMLSGKERRKRKQVLKSLRTIDDKRIMQDYTLLRFLESAPKSPLHFVLPKRFRKLFYRKGVPFFGLRGGIRLALAIIIAASVFLFLKPVDIPFEVRFVKSKGVEVYKYDIGLWEADYGDGIKMVYIPEGEFTMGSNDYDDEKPIHDVYLDGYWMGKYEVTLGQYKAFISDQGYAALPSYVSEYSPGDDHPVIGVSWEDANAYCKWLSDKKGLNFKLPTEAQWEKAARGSDSRMYPWGNNPPSGEKVNFADIKLSEKDKIFSWADKNVDDGYAYTAPVGSYPDGASPYGLLDMAGNVWEWCYDWYDIYSAEPQKNPTGPESGPYRVMRGGGWSYLARYLRCAFRNFVRPSSRNYYAGFRLCQDNR